MQVKRLWVQIQVPAKIFHMESLFCPIVTYCFIRHDSLVILADYFFDSRYFVLFTVFKKVYKVHRVFKPVIFFNRTTEAACYRIQPPINKYYIVASMKFLRLRMFSFFKFSPKKLINQPIKARCVGLLKL